MHIVMAGDPLGGFTCHGPFDTPLAAYDYAHNGPDTDGLAWWVVPLNAPLTTWKPTVPRGEMRCLFCGHFHPASEPELEFGKNPDPSVVTSVPGR